MIHLLQRKQMGSRPPRRTFRSAWLIYLSAILAVGLTPNAAKAAADTAHFYSLLRAGRAVYCQKQGYTSFLQSLRYFDSAQTIADQSNDALLKANATLARGSVYDAWNKEPAMTTELFSRAAAFYKQAGQEEEYLYAEQLVAHSYDKTGDSLHATAVLRVLVAMLSAKDTAFRHRTAFIPEMALIATEVRAYSLADSILQHLTQRSWITNDPTTYNYLDHYYLSQSRLDVYWRHRPQSAYLDSLAAVCNAAPSPLDQLYYAPLLAEMYAIIGNSSIAYKYRSLQARLQNDIAADKDFEKMQRALVASETAAGRRKLAYEESMQRSRTGAIWLLSLLLATITVLSLYLYRRNKKYRAQSQRLQLLNGRLDTQIAKVEVLNKEIQHRVKNNLYTIYSLLHMQQDSTDNEEVIAHLEAARLRVESVAALHDHLLAGSDTVDFGAYVKVLINKVVSCYADRRRVITHLSTMPVSLPLNTCFALSLILNEWITNSIKYAVVGGDVLNMTLSIASIGAEVCIIYMDDGSVTEGAAQLAGLGTEIIRLLTAQIKGRLTTTGGHPYHYNLCIPNG